jgi:hypothetical protein
VLGRRYAREQTVDDLEGGQALLTGFFEHLADGPFEPSLLIKFQVSLHEDAFQRRL